MNMQHILICLAYICGVAVGLQSYNQVSDIESIHVIADIRFRYAKTVFTSTIITAATSNATAEAIFSATFPNLAFISNFTYTINEVTYVAKLLDKESAEKYPDATSPAHYKQKVHETNSFNVGIVVPPRTRVTFSLTYEEVLERRNDVYVYSVYLISVPDLKIDVAVLESSDLASIDIRPLTNAVSINRKKSRSATVNFHPSVEEQMRAWSGKTAQFTIYYDVIRRYDAGELLVYNGHFVHYFAPKMETPENRNILFILDTSTSMFNLKLRNVKDAMTVILEDLSSRDNFNIITFSSELRIWRNEAVQADQRQILLAVKFIEEEKPRGWTNIKAAILSGLEHFSSTKIPENSAKIIIFLTDGQATIGETDARVILKSVREANTKHISIHTLALGKEADWDLLKQLAVQNSGRARRIYTDGQVAKQIEGFYDEVSRILISNLNFVYPPGTLRTTTRPDNNLYRDGSEITVVGTYNLNSALYVNVSGSSHMMITSDKLHVMNEKRSSSMINGIDLPGLDEIYLATTASDVDLTEVSFTSTEVYDRDTLEKFLPRLVAHVHIKQLLRGLWKEGDKHERDKLKENALKLSLKYGFVTPVTRLVVHQQNHNHWRRGVQDWHEANYEEDDVVFRYNEVLLPTPPPVPYWMRRRTSWRGGGGYDPHFMVYMDGLKYPVCFDVQGKDQEIYQFLVDPQTGLSINIRMATGSHRVYISEISITYRDLYVMITCDVIRHDKTKYSWNRNYNTTLPGASIFIKNVTSLVSSVSVVLDNGVQIDVVKHTLKKADLLNREFLNIEIGNENVLSQQSDGILGQFMHKTMTLKSIRYWKDHLVGYIKSRTGLKVDYGRALIRDRRDPVFNETRLCWFLYKKAQALFDHPFKYYIINEMNQTSIQ